MNVNSIPSVESPRHVTQGQVKRTLRGMDGRIRHVEALVAQAHDGRLARLDATEATIKTTVDALAALRTEVANLAAGLAIVRAQVERLAAHPALSVPSVDIDAEAPSTVEEASA